MSKGHKAPTETGTNRTGIKLSPIDSKAMIEGADQSAVSPGTPDQIDELRRELSEGAPPRGTVPPPATLKGVAKSAVETIKGNKPTVFIDLLGERLAFERGGVRLYQALMAKFEAADTDVHRGGPTRAELERFEQQELSHAALLVRAIEQIGADPTVMTPSADVVGVTATGLFQLLTDPRTTLTEALRGMLVAELTDNDGWRLLAQIAREMKHDDLAREFEGALAEEETHLERVRGWLTASVFVQAGAEPPVVQPSP